MYVDVYDPYTVVFLYLASFGGLVLAERRVRLALLKVSHPGGPSLAINTLLPQLGFDTKHGRSSISLSTARGVGQGSGRGRVQVNRARL